MISLTQEVFMKRCKYAKFLAVLLLVFSLSACKGEPVALTLKHANNIARVYFQDEYSIQINATDITSIQTGENKYLNLIHVEHGDSKYELVLDKDNSPLTANVDAIKTLSEFDEAVIAEDMRVLGASLNLDALQAVFSYQNSQYQASLHLNFEGKPATEDSDVAYHLFEMAKSEGLDQLIFSLSTPPFLLCNGEYGIQLASETFSSDMDKDKFSSKYLDFAQSICWDENKFNSKILELEKMGYYNVRFSILDMTPDTIRIELSLKSDIEITDEQAESICEELDDTFFKIGKKTTQFVFRYTR